MTIESFLDNYPLSDDPTAGYEKYLLYRTTLLGSNLKLALRLLSLETDIPMLHEWVNLPYSREFWQMELSKEELYAHYLSLISKRVVFPFVVVLLEDGREVNVAQIDVYPCLMDEVSSYFKATGHDFGMHLLMCPYRQLVSIYPELPRKFARTVLVFMMKYLFSFEAIDRLLVEPDTRNVTANKLVRDIGFQLLETIEMSYKIAHLYCYGKADFLKDHVQLS